MFEATLRDWQAVLDAVRKFQPPPTYIINGEVADMPISAEHILKLWPEASPLMSLSMNGTLLNCHVFGVGEIDFDIDSEEVTSQKKLDFVRDFMLILGNLTNKAVYLLEKCSRDRPIMRYFPGETEVSWVPSAEGAE